MKKWILFLLILANFSVKAQNQTLNQEVGIVVKSMESFNNEDSYAQAFKTIDKWCKEDSKNWLPLYYASLLRYEYYYAGFRKLISTDTKLLSDANQKLVDAMKLGQSEELILLKAYYLLDAAIKNPAERSSETTSTIQNLLSSARTINGSNPRLFLVEAMFSLISEDGDQGKDGARDVASQAAEFFSQGQVSAYPFAPTWGKLKVDEILKRINE